MSRPFGSLVKQAKRILALAVVLFLLSGQSAVAQNNGGGNGNNSNNFLFNVVGGIHVDPSGVLSSATVVDQREMRQSLIDQLSGASGDLGERTEMRMVSVRGLESALKEAAENGTPLSENVMFMAGLQRVQFVFLYPEQNDIVLAGPGEGWTVAADGSVVGETTGRPVLHLEDFLVAMRTSREASEGYGISCSIDPTAEGRQRYDNYMSRVRRSRQGLSPQVLEGAQEAMGPQQITLTGIPTDSRLARVLVAADYQMKRFAMGLEEAPLEEFPSFLQIMQQKRGRPTDLMPRWWLATNYEPLARSEDGLAWELRGTGVKCMTEDEYVSASGQVEGTGRQNPFAQQWAEMMTERYDELSVASPVFGDLRNIMDLAVISALIDKERMLQHVGLEAPTIFSKESQLDLGGWNAPTSVDTQCSFIRSGSAWIISASGGVMVDSWSVAENTEMDAQVGHRRENATREDQTSWHWN